MTRPGIQLEQDADHEAIRRVTEVAFRDMPYSDGTEPVVIERLRAAGALTLSLVAVAGGEIVGHIAFSPARLPDSGGRWFALGPVSVLPSHQRRGIGSALIQRGLAMLRQQHAHGCILIGDPDYYSRFGFKLSPANVPDEEPEEYFMVNLFGDAVPAGRFRFHPAFYGSD